MKTIRPGSILLGLSLVLVLATCGAASPANTPLWGAVGTGTGANAIVVHAQDVNAGQVMVDSVTAAKDGWLLIRKDKKGAPGDVIGFAPVRQGTSTNVRVDIQPNDIFGNDNITPTLWATLVADSSALAPFASPGPSITQYTSVAVVAFASSIARGLTASGMGSSGATNKYKIAVRAQDVNGGQVIIDSVTAAQGSWLLIRKDRKGAPDDMIGFASVPPGTTRNARVDLQLTDYYGEDNITPTLWATLVADPTALIPLASPDAWITQEASAAVVAFSSSVAGAAAPSQAIATVSASSPSSAASANRITARTQDTSSGRVIVDSVTAAQDGWLLIRKNANGRPGEVLGFAPVHKGLNTTLAVDIRTTNARGDSLATPVLWATLVADPTALNPFALPTLTVQLAGSLATVAFSTR